MKLRFDGSPGPSAPRFIEAEDNKGNSVRVGKWQADSESSDWFLVLSVEPLLNRIERLFSEIRGDWIDPRTQCERGRQAVERLKIMLGAQKDTAS